MIIDAGVSAHVSVGTELQRDVTRPGAGNFSGEGAPMKSQSREAREKALSAGRSLWDSVPRGQHAVWKASMHRVDPLEARSATNRTRLPHLLPLRLGRVGPDPVACCGATPGLPAQRG